MITKYRPDIDGLRAIAVLSVVTYHFGLSGVLSGGFIGVDIFFVISGFLITKIIFREILEEKYDIISFYNRRILRIFPAYFAMLFFSITWASFKLFNSEFFDQGLSAIYSITFISNIRFWKISDYFDPMIHNDLFLHTWSLSVEEQFYIFLPLGMMLLYRYNEKFKKNSGLLITVVTILSLFLCINASRQDFSSQFYLMPFRAWELLLGSLLAVDFIPRLPSKRWAELNSFLGLFGIGLSLLLISESTRFPGYFAILPCLSTAAIIHAGIDDHRTLTLRLLSLKPVQFIGKISYSLYLWHWPILIIYTNEYQLRGFYKLLIFAISIFIATISWYYIERPFRKPIKAKDDQKIILRNATLLILLTPLLILSISSLKNRISPESEETRRILDYQKASVTSYFRTDTCMLSTNSNDIRYFDKNLCLTLSNNRSNILIYGDSHAGHLWYGAHNTLSSYNVMQATASGCLPNVNPVGLKRCVDLINFINREFLPHSKKLKAIVLAGRWERKNVNEAIDLARYLIKFSEKVIIVGPVPTYSQSLPRIIALANSYSLDPIIYAGGKLLPESKLTDDLFKEKKMPDRVVYASAYAALCPRGRCVVLADPFTPIAFDYGHLTRAGSDILAERLKIGSLVK